MPYFRKNDINILFIHIPKTGGTSIETYFSQKYDIPLNYKSLFYHYPIQRKLKINSTLQHITYKSMYKYKKELKIKFNNIKIITIVRNPYERIISDLFYFDKIDIKTKKDEVFTIIQKYLTQKYLDNHNIPQYKFIIDKNKNIIPNLHILHTETLTTDMNELGFVDFNEFKNANPNKINYYKYLNNDSIQLINQFYDKDFSLFGYEKIIV